MTIPHLGSLRSVRLAPAWHQKRGRADHPRSLRLAILPCVEQFLGELIQHLPYGLYLIVCEFICF